MLEAYITLVIEAGGDFNNEFRSQASNEQNFVFEALTRLHARACQISSEITVLIENGFANGAHARWRSLHEITVVAIFIKENGNDVAEKYLLHNHIESFKAAQEFQKHYQVLGETPITEANLSDIKEIHDRLIERFGKYYGNNLGWASETLKNKDPKINHIEAAVGLEHMRPYYRLASHNVHANPKGIFFKLGLYENQDLLLAGASNIGLADPAQATSFSLLQITTELPTIYPNLDRLVVCGVLAKFADEIADKFVTTQQNIKEKINTPE